MERRDEANTVNIIPATMNKLEKLMLEEDLIEGIETLTTLHKQDKDDIHIPRQIEKLDKLAKQYKKVIGLHD